MPLSPLLADNEKEDAVEDVSLVVCEAVRHISEYQRREGEDSILLI